MHSLVTSIFLYVCESWTLTAELHRRIQAIEMKCYHKILHISYKDHVTNEEIRAKIQQAIGPHEDLLTMVKRCRCRRLLLIRSGQNHLARHSERGKKTRQTEEEMGRQHQGMNRPGVCQIPEGSRERREMEETGCEVICGAPRAIAVKGLMMMMMILSSLSSLLFGTLFFFFFFIFLKKMWMSSLFPVLLSAILLVFSYCFGRFALLCNFVTSVRSPPA